MNGYSIILADPPWKYNARVNHNTRFGGGAGGHYPLMTMQEVRNLPVDGLGAKNAALFLWSTFPYLDKQIELFEHWGYRYRTVGFTWVKLNPGMYRNAMNDGLESEFSGLPLDEMLDKLAFFGTGYYAKANLEVCLLGVRGRMKPVSNKVSSVVFAPRGKHSAKPPIVRDKIVRLFGDLPRIELFARETAPGWDCWGDEIDGVSIERLAEYS